MRYAMTTNRATIRLARNEQGGIAIFAGLCLSIMLGCAALAVDLASMYLERRTLQGVADLAAINAAAFPDEPEAAANATLVANGTTKVRSVIVTKGHYEPDSSMLASLRFRPNVEPFNAVRVQVTKEARLVFGKMFVATTPLLGVAATAGYANAATYSIGSRLAAVRGGIANSVLSALLGADIRLSVMDYNALVDTNVRIDSALNGIAQKLNLKAGTYRDVLGADIPLTSLLSALQSVVQASGNSNAGSTLMALADQSSRSTAKVQLGKLIDLGPYATLAVGRTHPGLSATVGLLDMIRGAAFLANGSKQVSVDLQLDIPGVAKSVLKLAIGEPMQYSAWAAVGQVGSMVRTAQLKFRLSTEIGGTGLLSGLTIRLPIYAEAAYAEAKLDNVACSANSERANATIATTPGVARLAIANVTDAMLSSPTLWQDLQPATLVAAPLITVTGRSEVAVGNSSPTYLNFTQSDIRSMTIKQADTNSFLQSIATSLIGKLSLQVQILGLGLATPSTITSAVATHLQAVAMPLDDALYDIMTTLGVHLGEADVRVNGIRCGSASLVN